MLFHPLSPHLLPRGSLYARFIYLCVGSLQKGATTERRGFSTGQKTLDGYPSWHWEWPPSVLRGSHQRPLPEIASLQCLWQYTHDLIRTENKRRKEKKRREDSLLNCPSAGNADCVDANTLSPEERQIHLHRQALVTSQTPSPTRSSWSDVSLPLWLTLAHTGLQSMHTHTHCPKTNTWQVWATAAYTVRTRLSDSDVTFHNNAIKSYNNCLHGENEAIMLSGRLKDLRQRHCKCSQLTM